MIDNRMLLKTFIRRNEQDKQKFDILQMHTLKVLEQAICLEQASSKVLAFNEYVDLQHPYKPSEK